MFSTPSEAMGDPVGGGIGKKEAVNIRGEGLVEFSENGKGSHVIYYRRLSTVGESKTSATKGNNDRNGKKKTPPADISSSCAKLR